MTLGETATRMIRAIVKPRTFIVQSNPATALLVRLGIIFQPGFRKIAAGMAAQMMVSNM